jgi:hypothetical protein
LIRRIRDLTNMNWHVQIKDGAGTFE